MSTRTWITQLTVALTLCATAPFAPGATAATDTTPTLIDIRAAHHPASGTAVARDRIVFDFAGPVPEHRSARWVTEPRYLTPDAGEVGLVPIQGNAYLQLIFYSARGHEEDGQGTYGPSARAFGLPDVMHVVNNNDFEDSMGFLVGVSQRTPFRMFTLTSPSRIVVDLDVGFRTVPVRTFFQDVPAYQQGLTPDVRAVTRQVVPPATARGALQRLFAGPTESEKHTGLGFVASGAKGFSNLSITNGVARVHLTGGCDSGGSTFTVASLIVPTLRQFPTVSTVKIYDPDGTTEHPTGPDDSVPECLEP